MKATIVRGLTLAGLMATPALAHHGWSSYDSTKLVTLQGPVLESRFGNPHGSVTIEHEGKRWEAVLAPPSRMTARGLTEADIAVGATVKLEGYVSTRVATELRAERIIVGSKTVELR
ncbi:DUF6152 family protein [Methylopila sp. Yamaguchi]|uniref:DUF6152 family protein n=1 Tax=Methylopila sp. Yamaguchi TaxID=1437817 RepID=UPI000CB10A34|nr:DUF6152 family protein [Methylopila sp. Yamaguchi]GBD47252.1 hypothetical protein METY_0465 [Methylopila sp. Yamaguchi]